MAGSATTETPSALVPTPIVASNRPTLFVIDGSYYMYRAYFAAPHLSTKKGFPTGALLIFTGMVLGLIKEQNPTYVAVTFDPDVTFRHALFPAYKANRAEPPPELSQQRPLFKQITQALGLNALEISNFEADDIMGTLAKKGSEAGLHVVLVSGDKDLMQLLGDPHVQLLDTMSSRRKLFTREDVLERFQVAPERVAEVLALSGDSSDNIPGVPGIGEKTAGALIAEFGTLQNLLDNTSKISAKKRRENIEATRDQLPLFLQLTTLCTDLPIDMNLDLFKVNPPQRAELRALFTELEFHRYIQDLQLDAPDLTAAADAQSVKHYETISTPEQWADVLSALRASKVFAVDLETTSVDPVRAEIVGVALAWKPDHGVYVPLRHHYLGVPPQLPFQRILDDLKPLLEAQHPQKVAQHAKYESVIFARHNIHLAGLVCDTMLASYVLDPGRESHSMDALALEFLKYRTVRYEDVAGKGKKQRRFDEVEIERATPYAAEDADITLLLYQTLYPKLQENPALQKLHDEVELPLSDVLADMERVGILVDREQLQVMSVAFAQDMARLEAEARALLGAPVNLNSPKQLSEILYTQLKLKPANKRATVHGQSTDQETLETMLDQHRLPALVLEYRGVTKLRSTYTDALTALIHPQTGRVHTSFNQAIAATGRLSSSNPNLQNIPIRTDAGRRIRRAFIPAPGWLLLSADYSQIELRLLAHCSAEPTLCAAFQQNLDVHALTASAIFGVPVEAVTDAQRRIGKTVNFSVIYGVGNQRLAQTIEASREDAQRFIDGFFIHYTQIQPYFDRLIKQAQSDGFVTTLLGRRRYIPELTAGREHVQKQGERFVINTPIQGSSADIIKLAMLDIHKKLLTDAKHLRTKLLLQVHDELLFEVHPDDLQALSQLTRSCMENAYPLSVPLKVDLSAGPNWADVSPLA